MSHADFVHLRVHSAYSLSEGAIKVKDLIKLCKKERMPAVAVTDNNNLFGVYEISDTLAKAGIQPIVGALVSVEFAVRGPQTGSRKKPPHVALLVQNEVGYQNLTKLLSAAYLEVEAGDWPHIKAAKLYAHGEGLILLTGGPGGVINQLLLDGQREQAAATLDELAGAFPDRLYVELQRHNLPEERACVLAEQPPGSVLPGGEQQFAGSARGVEHGDGALDEGRHESCDLRIGHSRAARPRFVEAGEQGLEGVGGAHGRGQFRDGRRPGRLPRCQSLARIGQR